MKKTSVGLLKRMLLPKFPAIEIDGAVVFQGCDVSQDQLEEAAVLGAVMRKKPQKDSGRELHELNLLNQKRYAVTAWFYDFLDYPWERQYRKWRPELLKDVSGDVLEAGVGTGRNLQYYPHHVNLTAIDLSPAMLKKASRRCSEAACSVTFVHEDASRMLSIPSAQYDWIVSFFLCCVLPNELQEQAVSEFARVLKPGGRFRLLEMKYSENPALRKRQERFAPFVAKVYGAGFDRDTLSHLEKNKDLTVTGTRFLKADTYLLIDGIRKG